MQNDLLKYLSLNRKTKIGIIVAIVVVVSIIIFIVWWKQNVSQKIHDKKINTDLANLLDEEITTENITITQQQLNSYASKLYKAMDGWGTDEQQIFDVFRQMQTRSDVLQLIKTFGVKDHKTLQEWLFDELSTSDLDKINQILSNNAIDYKF